MNKRVKSYKQWKNVKRRINDFDGVNKGAVSIRILPALGLCILPSMDNALANPKKVHISVLDNMASTHRGKLY